MRYPLPSALLCGLLSLPLGGCGGPDVGGQLQPTVTRSSDIALDVAEQRALTAGNSDFAFELYRLLRGGDGNLFYSPHSISLALALCYAGARGETAQQIAAALRFRLPAGRLHPAFNWLDRELASRAGGSFRLHIANALWGQRGYAFRHEYLDTLSEHYDAALWQLDFTRFPERSRSVINQWVAEQTQQRIQGLMPSGAINIDTRLVLTNAIYFAAPWRHPFKRDDTAVAVFHAIDGARQPVPMMRQTERFAYASGAGYQALELPYANGGLSMLILLPSPGNFRRFEASLSRRRFTALSAEHTLAPRQVLLTMPKFEFAADLDLIQALSALGMPIAFTGVADFSGMTGGHELSISGVAHKAFVSVDEAGTEAAAATAVVMRLTSMPPEQEPLELRIDRPFLFLIRDRETGTVLFIGRVLRV